MCEIYASGDTPEQLPETRTSRLEEALREFARTAPDSQGELLAHYVGVAVLIHPGDTIPRYHVFYSPGLGTYQEAELTAVLEDHLAARRSQSFRNI